MSDFCSSCHTSYQDVELLADGKCATCLAKEVERLRAQLADSISRETVIATELERDEALLLATQAEQVIYSINTLRDRAYEEIKQERDEAREAARFLNTLTSGWADEWPWLGGE